MAKTLDLDTYPIARGGFSDTLDYNKKEMNYGDGYRQIIIDGVNYEQEVCPLEFAALDTTSSLTLRTILANSINGESNYLSITSTEENEIAYFDGKYWTASGISRVALNIPGQYKISCTLRREYPLV